MGDRDVIQANVTSSVKTQQFRCHIRIIEHLRNRFRQTRQYLEMFSEVCDAGDTAYCSFQGITHISEKILNLLTCSFIHGFFTSFSVINNCCTASQGASALDSDYLLPNSKGHMDRH